MGSSVATCTLWTKPSIHSPQRCHGLAELAARYGEMRRLANPRHHVPPLANLIRPSALPGKQPLLGRRTSIQLLSSFAEAWAVVDPPPTRTISRSSAREIPPTPDSSSTPALCTSSVRDRPFDHDHPTEYINAAIKLYYSPKDCIDPEIRELALRLASRRGYGLATITAQAMLYSTPNLDPAIQGLLPQGDEWDKMLFKVAEQGFQSQEVFHWVQVLLARTPEERASHFLSGQPVKPSFLLNYIINGKSLHGQRPMRRQTMFALIEYCKTDLKGILHSPKDARSAAGQLSAKYLNPDSSILTLKGLVSLARHVEPKGIHEVARLAVLCLERLATANSSNPKDLLAMYRFRCRIFNAMLQELSIATRHNAYSNRHWNWKGIMELLAYSSGLDKPLTIERKSYRAIRSVLMGLAKATPERDTATALRETWPPYRILRNGIEEATPLATFKSRVAKAGAMMSEAGYGKEIFDAIVDVLGGEGADGTPTIQTRAVVACSKGATAANIWAARVRATRNAEEAWQAVLSPLESGLQLHRKVCEQMIYKIVSNLANNHHHNLPGDGRETFPFSDLNYSDHEKARLAPPTLDQFTCMMHEAGVPLESGSLRAAIRWASNCSEALTYIHRSTLPQAQQATLEIVLSGLHDHADRRAIEERYGVPPADVCELPRGVVHAVVDQLCRSQPNLTSAGPQFKPPRLMNRITTAISLVQEYNNPQCHELWESILEALSRPNILLKNSTLENNALIILATSGHVLVDAQKGGLVTMRMFELFARVVRKTMQTRLPSLIRSAQRADPDIPKVQSSILLAFLGLRPQPDKSTTRPFLANEWPSVIASRDIDKAIEVAHSALKAMWWELSETRGPGTSVVTATAVSVNNYMRVLGFLGDHDEMARLAGWALNNIEEIASNSEAKIDTKCEEYLSRALCAFRAFAEPMLDCETVSALRRQAEPRRESRLIFELRWPSDREVDMYMHYDHWGDRQNLRTLVDLAKEFRSQNRGGGDGGAHVEADEAQISTDVWFEFKEIESHVSRIKAGLAERYGGPGLALTARAMPDGGAR